MQVLYICIYAQLLAEFPHGGPGIFIPRRDMACGRDIIAARERVFSRRPLLQQQVKTLKMCIRDRLNSAACIYMTQNDITMDQAVAMAADIIDSGKALEQLNRFVELSNTI